MHKKGVRPERKDLFNDIGYLLLVAKNNFDSYVKMYFNTLKHIKIFFRRGSGIPCNGCRKPVGCSSEPGKIFFSGRQSSDVGYVPNESGRGIEGGMPAAVKADLAKDSLIE